MLYKHIVHACMWTWHPNASRTVSVPSAAGKLKTRLIGRPASATRTAATTGDMRIAEHKVNRVHGSKGNPCEDTKIAKIWAERGL